MRDVTGQPFEALLLSYGDAPDFRRDTLAVVIDGAQLKPNGKNSASGSFTVAGDWGEGKLNFCAVGTSTTGEQTWLSNVRSFDAPAESDPFIFFVGDEDPNGAI